MDSMEMVATETIHHRTAPLILPILRLVDKLGCQMVSQLNQNHLSVITTKLRRVLPTGWGQKFCPNTLRKTMNLHPNNIVRAMRMPTEWTAGHIQTLPIIIITKFIQQSERE